MTFGTLVKDKRLAKKMGLRRFCLATNMDPSTWSKVERGLAPPTQNESKLLGIADVLGLNPNERREFLDQAKVASGRIPEGVQQDRDLMEVLPAFFRTIQDMRPSQEEFRAYVEAMVKHES